MHFRLRIPEVQDKQLIFKTEAWGAPPAACVHSVFRQTGLVLSSSLCAHTSTSPFSSICFFRGKQITRELPLLAISAYCTLSSDPSWHCVALTIQRMECSPAFLLEGMGLLLSHASLYVQRAVWPWC